MTECVLDASAVTAVLRKEPGFENVLPHLRGSFISSVNVAEVLCTARRHGSSVEMDERALSLLNLTHVPFDDIQAKIVASIYTATLGGEMGIADRICLSLGIYKQLPVVTGDREWLKHELGVEVRLFRHQNTLRPSGSRR